MKMSIGGKSTEYALFIVLNTAQFEMKQIIFERLRDFVLKRLFSQRFLNFHGRLFLNACYGFAK